VVSTAIGIEGLDIQPDEHFLQRDGAQEMADALLALFGNAALRQRLARQARQCVELRFGHRVAAQVFEDICLRSLQPQRGALSVATETVR